MGVVFSASVKLSAPRFKTCSYCNGTLRDERDRECLCVEYANPSAGIFPGTEYDMDHDGPTLDVNNVNWSVIAQAVGLDREYGELSAEAVPMLSEQISSLISNASELAESADVAVVGSVGPRTGFGARVIMPPSATTERWVERLERMRMVAEFAIGSGVGVQWS
jgi:hypothetical protein